MKFGYKRKSHLKSKRIISQLFADGGTLNRQPLRLVYLVVCESDFSGIQVLVSVPKRRFKRAVVRNRIKRLISEAYRLNSLPLQQFAKEHNKHLAIGFIYIGKQENSFMILYKKMNEILNELLYKLSNNKRK